jgi:DNA-binding response OmpR family regulator
MKVLTFLTRLNLERRIKNALSSAQFVVDTTSSEQECLDLTRSAKYEGILLDSDSYSLSTFVPLVKRLREENSSVALCVFARYLDLEQRLTLFQADIDDCILEPFFATEFTVRLGLAIRLRRAAVIAPSSENTAVLRAGELELNLIRRRAMRLGQIIDLRPKEFLLLELLMRNANRLVTRSMILEHVWNSSFDGLGNIVDVYISSLRSKVDRNYQQKLIHTKHGTGYTLVYPERHRLKPATRDLPVS